MVEVVVCRVEWTWPARTPARRQGPAAILPLLRTLTSVNLQLIRPALASLYISLHIRSRLTSSHLDYYSQRRSRRARSGPTSPPSPTRLDASPSPRLLATMADRSPSGPINYLFLSEILVIVVVLIFFFFFVSPGSVPMHGASSLTPRLPPPPFFSSDHTLDSGAASLGVR